MDNKTRDRIIDEVLSIKRNYNCTFDEIKQLIEVEENRVVIPTEIRLDKGDKYYYIASDCKVEEAHNENRVMDYCRFDIHNAYPNDAFPKMIAQQYKALLLKNWFKWNSNDRDYEPTVTEKERGYYVSCDKKGFVVEGAIPGSFSENEVYFSTYDMAQECADWLNDLFHSKSSNE